MQNAAILEGAVRDRYTEGARIAKPNLCCPTSYDPRLLEALPKEIIERDYGCGDPSRYVRSGDVVLDLGSGTGKMCYMASQLVGPSGHVIGVDVNDDMLALARKYRSPMAIAFGTRPVDFIKCRIQDLKTDLEQVEKFIASPFFRHFGPQPVAEDWLRQTPPAVTDGSVDLVISNCVLNLVGKDERQQLIREIHRVLKPGGRVAIADVVSDKEVPQNLQENPDLWADCISGAFQEQEFMRVFTDTGFTDLAFDKWTDEAWQVLEGIEFRSVTLTAVKPVTGPCIYGGKEVIYRGPFSRVHDDDKHEYLRGSRTSVCDKTYQSLLDGPMSQSFIFIGGSNKSTQTPACQPGGDCC